MANPEEVLKQARYFVGNVVEAGPSLPSRQKWSGLHSLSLQMHERLTAAIEALPRIEWSSEARAFVCTEHGKDALFQKSAGWSRQQHMPLHVHKCRECGAESKPAIHADLGL